MGSRQSSIIRLTVNTVSAVIIITTWFITIWKEFIPNSNSPYPIGFYTYIAGGFGKTIDKQIQDEVRESDVHGSGIIVSNFIKMIENQQNGICKYSHSDLRRIFGLDRQVMLKDVFEGGRSVSLYKVPEPTTQMIGLAAEQSHFLGDN